ncbi:hypothetical protein K7R23_18825 [Citrobacter rodentium NBRC 105723 = DSM 16636]|uniref:hypothetical protein n=1 Tax=Citrobacter rodentium TaxID=67825 RepID=UPI000B2C4B03|nr:hypothetical protein [Citrobacter rodentium]UHO30033.1 hypothetical protein K7R23_18825 [Citrobacter rodentium NBRC 105723 = DSM 16636]
MQRFLHKKLTGKRWNLRPETQDLQHARSAEQWSGRTACCDSKKEWKRVSQDAQRSVV